MSFTHSDRPGRAYLATPPFQSPIEESGSEADHSQFWSGAVLGLSAILAVILCTSYAGSWNDGSRLATVEALVDHGTWAIDDSIFVRPVPGHSPYPESSSLTRTGTMDKMFIDGQFYSDKSPVPALLMAGQYWVIQKLTGLKASEHPRNFCLVMTLLSSGLAYVVAVWCMYLLGQRVGLSLGLRLMATGAFALSSLAPVYLRQVNNHILLLGVASPLMLALHRLGEHRRKGRSIRGPLLAIGLLTGFGYTIDLGVGPVLLLTMSLYIVWRCWNVGAVLFYGLLVLPWLLLHHVVNYSIGGALAPANSVAEHFLYPGSPFNAENMTGAWKHPTLGRGAVYLLALLFGKHGFFGHNLPLFLLLSGTFILLYRRVKERPEMVVALLWCGGTWLLYGSASTNYSGYCASVRWFVPLLAPSFFVLMLILREVPKTRAMFAVLSVGGFYLSMVMVYRGPWTNKMVPGYWVVQGLALLICGWIASRGESELKRVRAWGEKIAKTGSEDLRKEKAIAI